MRTFECGRCGRPVYFENTHCGNCQALLGYAPADARMAAFEAAPEPDAPWQGVGRDEGRTLRPCANRGQHQVCNWMLDGDDAAALCRSCRLTTVIPALDVPGHREHWAAIEQAKRRLLVTLIDIGLEPQPKRGEDDADGLAFHLLASPAEGPKVMTGHAAGVITIDIAEADDAYREAARVAFGEPMRTLLGHLRHEVAHYLQYRWLRSGRPLMQFRAVFGDERADYAEALQRYHAGGAPADWPARFISAYASAHPHEDWAETCAHVLLALDAVETAAAWGLRLDGPAAKTRPLEPDGVAEPLPRLVVEHWLPVARFINAMNRSLGQRDAYPFTFSDAVLAKMAAVQRLLRGAVKAAAAL
jgi:hypothetical protein